MEVPLSVYADARPEHELQSKHLKSVLANTIAVIDEQLGIRFTCSDNPRPIYPRGGSSKNYEIKQGHPRIRQLGMSLVATDCPLRILEGYTLLPMDKKKTAVGLLLATKERRIAVISLPGDPVVAANVSAHALIACLRLRAQATERFVALLDTEVDTYDLACLNGAVCATCQAICQRNALLLRSA